MTTRGKSKRVAVCGGGAIGAACVDQLSHQPGSNAKRSP
jgi:hypothetical protein